MAGPQPVYQPTFVPDEALVQFTAVKISGDGTVEASDTAGEAIIGVVQHTVSADDATNNRPVAVRVMGATKALSGGSISAGARLQADGSAGFITAATSDVVVGIALQDANNNDLFDMLLTPGGGIEA